MTLEEKNNNHHVFIFRSILGDEFLYERMRKSIDISTCRFVHGCVEGTIRERIRIPVWKFIQDSIQNQLSKKLKSYDLKRKN